MPKFPSARKSQSRSAITVCSCIDSLTSGEVMFNFPSTSAKPASAPGSATVPSLTFTGATPTTSSGPFTFGMTPSPSQQQASSGTAAPPSSSAGPSNNTGSLFGQQAGQSSLFGAQNQQPPAQGTTGLFGQSQTQPSQPQQSGFTSMFGQPSNQASSSSTSLFGQQPANQSSSGGLFGQQGTTQPAGAGLFGQQPTTQPSAGLFGQQSTTQPSTSLFGQSTAPQSSSLFAPSSMAPSATQTGVNKFSKFSELPETAQRTIEQLDGWIKQQKEAGTGLNVEALGIAIRQSAVDVKAATEDASALTQGLGSLQNSLMQLRNKLTTEEEDLRKLGEIWETFKSVDGRPGAVRVAAHRDFPQDFFSRVVNRMEERVGRYRKTITQLQRVVQSMYGGEESPSPQAIAQTIQNHQSAILTIAAQLEQLQLRTNSLKAVFVDDYRAQTNSMRDPFEMAREERAVQTIRG